jgi:hypothetical protein
MSKRACRQCGKPNAVPPAHHCPTCKRVNKKAAAKRAHSARIFKTYGITGEQYDQLYELQGGKCAICVTSTGASKRLAVDHNHDTGEVRGLVCGRCNHNLLGAAHDTTDILKRALEYLLNPPARKLLKGENA